MYIQRVIEKMKEVFKDIPYGIDHTLKVMDNASHILESINLEEEKKEMVLLAAILHDIGAVEAQRKYGSMDSRYQELEGPPIARKILQQAGYDPGNTARICYIVGNHHPPSKIDGIDFQVLWEADLLENMPFMGISADSSRLKAFIDENFKTVSGKALVLERFYM